MFGNCISYGAWQGIHRQLLGRRAWLSIYPSEAVESSYDTAAAHIPGEYNKPDMITSSSVSIVTIKCIATDTKPNSANMSNRPYSYFLANIYDNYDAMLSRLLFTGSI